MFGQTFTVQDSAATASATRPRVLGEVAERLNALVSKTSTRLAVSGVRIPPSPLRLTPCSHLLYFQRSAVRGSSFLFLDFQIQFQTWRLFSANLADIPIIGFRQTRKTGASGSARSMTPRDHSRASSSRSAAPRNSTCSNALYACIATRTKRPPPCLPTGAFAAWGHGTIGA